MVTIDDKKTLKYFLFGSLYFSEGLMIAITTVATLLYLREQAVPIPITTLIVGIVNIPWMLKFVWGPVVDHFKKLGRKTFIILGGILSVSSMFVVSFIDPNSSLLPFTFLLFLSHVGIGFIDVSTDAWAVDVSTQKDRGKINGSMYAGQYGAWAIGAALFPFIGTHYGYSSVYLLNALFIFLILLFPFIVKEKKKRKTKGKDYLACHHRVQKKDGPAGRLVLPPYFYERRHHVLSHTNLHERWSWDERCTDRSYCYDFPGVPRGRFTDWRHDGRQDW